MLRAGFEYAITVIDWLSIFHLFLGCYLPGLKSTLNINHESNEAEKHFFHNEALVENPAPRLLELFRPSSLHVTSSFGT
jgi:hypothetical protein